MEVIAASEGSDSRLIGTCGPKYAAPFDIGPGEIPTYTHASGVRIELLSRTASTPKYVSPSPDLKSGKLVIVPAEPELTLDSLVQQITDENRHEEIGTGRRVGNEIW